LDHAWISFYQICNILIREIPASQPSENYSDTVGVLPVIQTQVDVRQVFSTVRETDYPEFAAIANEWPDMLPFRGHFSVFISIKDSTASYYFNIEPVDNTVKRKIIGFKLIEFG